MLWTSARRPRDRWMEGDIIHSSRYGSDGRREGGREGGRETRVKEKETLWGGREGGRETRVKEKEAL